MFILSEGVRRTGVLQRVGTAIVRLARGRFGRQYAAVIGLAGGTAGLINNTPVVAMMIPMVMGIARKTKTSPSKLLMPLSFAAMLGGMLTLIGTSTSILASDVVARLLGRPLTLFEFTPLGALVLATGSVYLFTVGRWLLPERVKPEEDLTEEFKMGGYLTEVVVTDDSPLVGDTVGRALSALNLDADVVQIIRQGTTFPAPFVNKQFRAGDVLMVRTSRSTLLEMMQTLKLEPYVKTHITEADFDLQEKGETLIELVVLSDNPVVGETLQSLQFAQRYDALVLALRRSGTTLQERIDRMPLRGGDTLLVQASEAALRRFNANRTFVVVQDAEDDFRVEKTPVALAIVGGVVALAAFSLLPIMVAALGGVLAMIGTGCIRPNEMYRAVDWSVIVLLAGVIPLGVAMERTGGATYLAHVFSQTATGLSPFLVLLFFYLFTALITEVISNNASVVLMIPVAVETATLTGINPFSLVFAVIFAASCALLTPVGYQTNLMVYGPGGYRFTDFFRVGGLLQLLLAFVTCGGIWTIWGV
jgi:di/tricarboxylate transporter